MVAKKKKSVGTGKRAGKASAHAGNEEDSDTTASTSYLPSFAELQQRILMGGAFAVNFALTNRAYLFFGLASAAVAVYGDYASV